MLAQCGLPTEAPRIGAALARKLMRMDKKVLAGAVRLVLLAALGEAVVSGDYAEAPFGATLAEYFG